MGDAGEGMLRRTIKGRPSVIVTDAESRLGLYVIRALGRSGCRVTAVAKGGEEPAIGFRSRYASETHRLKEGDYWKTLPHALDELSSTHDVVVPVSAFSIAVVHKNASRLEGGLSFFLPPAEAFRHASDKRSVTVTAEQVGVPVPRTFEGLTPQTIEDWSRRHENRLPLVIKFSDEDRDSHWAPEERYRIVRSAEELVREYLRMDAVASNPLVQEYVDGDGYGYFALFDSTGEAVAEFGHRRLREYPVTGGPSTLCESVADPRLMELGRTILKALDWQGVAMVEFKRDRRTGEYKLLEINPRFWGSLPLALQCGVNFPLEQVRLALGERIKQRAAYPVGAKMRFLLTDLLAFKEEWRRERSFGVGWRYLRELCDLRIKDGILSLDDPRPFFTYLRQGLRR